VVDSTQIPKTRLQNFATLIDGVSDNNAALVGSCPYGSGERRKQRRFGEQPQSGIDGSYLVYCEPQEPGTDSRRWQSSARYVLNYAYAGRIGGCKSGAWYGATESDYRFEWRRRKWNFVSFEHNV
jgi:hypothetical protein